METRAHYILVGLFTIAATVAALAFGYWMARPSKTEMYRPYDIIFEGRVPGLRNHSDVTFNGIRVGEVVWLHFETGDPSKVRARVNVARHAPITADSIAQVRMQGFTGTGIVEISGGRTGSPPLEPGPGQDVPVIASRRTSLEELTAELPQILERTNKLLEGISTVFGETNRGRIETILENIGQTTAALAESRQELKDTLTNARAMTAQFRDLALRADQFVAESGPELRDDLHDLVQRARTSLLAFDRAADGLAQAVADNRRPLDEFTTRGLPVFVGALEELRQTMEATKRVLEDFERDPRTFLLGKPATKEYKKP